MNDLIIFTSEEFGQVRTATIDNEPYVCMMDICKSLDITNVSDAKKRLKEDGVASSEVIDSLGRKQQANFINESNMYKLIFQSRKESAERFTDWVTGEVLPAIRKTGTYQKPLTALEQISLHNQAILEVNEKVDDIKQDIEDFKRDLPVLALDLARLRNARNRKVVPLLGGAQANAYKDNKLRGKVYSDNARQVWRQYGIKGFNELKRSQVDSAISIINSYELPFALVEEIIDCNAQMCMR